MTTTEWVDDHFISGNLALDFANTVYRRWPEPGPDLLTDTDALAAWLTHTHLLPKDRSMVSGAILEEARALRARLWDVVDAHNEHHRIPIVAFAGILDTAQRASSQVTLSADGSRGAGNPQGALSVLALRSITLTLDPPPSGIRACARCGWFFIDSSRGQRRRWCSMKTCGNQAKAARYRSTHQ